MQSKTDADLLREYATENSEAAFGEIVRRYADFVYSAALRQVGNPEQARDVAQTVFLDLARKAGTLRASSLLIGWLCNAARLAALEQLRKDQRRQKRERQAMESFDPTPETPGDWTVVRPVLDAALASLDYADRDALLLRFFKNESLSAVGTALGVSEDAAQKRVSRALEKLREFLAGRGIRTTAAALSVALAANAVQAAPAGFAGALTASALVKAAATQTPTVSTLLSLTTMKTALLILALTGGLATATVLNLNARREARDARTQLAQQADELAQLRAATQQLAAQSDELERMRAELEELARLRGEVARLRQTAASVPITVPTTRSTAAVSTNAAGPDIMIESKFVSLPRSALADLNRIGLPFLQSGGAAILTESQFKLVNEAFQGASDAVVLGIPRVLTRSGTSATISMGQEVPLAGTNTHVGIKMDIAPEYSGAVFDLDLNAQLTHLMDASSQSDGSQLRLESIKVATRIHLMEGQIAVLAKDIPGDGWLDSVATNGTAGPRTLLVFVTPSIAKVDPRFQDRLTSRLVPVTRVVDTNSVETAVRANPQ